LKLGIIPSQGLRSSKTADLSAARRRKSWLQGPYR
jgi:hypothetical protein